MLIIIGKQSLERSFSAYILLRVDEFARTEEDETSAKV